jgi:hypothetical protein
MVHLLDAFDLITVAYRLARSARASILEAFGHPPATDRRPRCRP